jgi:hypothetical protein
VGVIIVPSHTVCEFPAPAFRIAAPSSNSFFAPASVVSIRNSPAFSAALDTEISDNDADGLGCARGVRSAILLQGGMFLVGYGAWLVWHLAR